MSFTKPLRGPSMAWPDGELFEDHPRGTLKSGKEAEIFLVERRFARSGPRLLAHKRYRPRYPGKGELRDVGFSNSTSYRGDAIYKSGWNMQRARQARGGSGNKQPVRPRTGGPDVADAGVDDAAPRLGGGRIGPVPGRAERGRADDGVHRRRVGQAAPKLAQARLSRTSWNRPGDSSRARSSR